ncbi:uncharacterized protein LOC133185142 [Saccostrea echinata]|uniref:uncharacterized protein LOC133185142 n=1 Tax=Saccostrea echinata TaxID=191078 RepID=UPI002A81CE53|nr:uncharacterized protein LOC133185142 [Saccostrea echinata]
MAEFGNFDLCDDDPLLYLLFDNDILAALDLPFMAPASVEETEEVEKELKMSDMEGLPSPGMPTPPPPPPSKRFKSMTEEDLKQFEDSRQSISTKRNTQWGVKLFQDWHLEVFSDVLDFKTVTSEILAEKLRKFYCEAKPKSTSERTAELTVAQAENYHKNSLKNLRAAINRHLQDLGRSIDIVRDKEFKTANHTLDGMLKSLTKTGASRTTNHKTVIHPEDLQRISTYFLSAPHSPIVLRQCVWYNLSIHLVTRGLEFHHQLLMDSFQFHKDENNLEYITLRHETQQKTSKEVLHLMKLLLESVYTRFLEVKPVALVNEQDRSQCYKSI